MKAVKEIIKKYYKYVSRNGNLPTFASASQASSGVDGVSVSPTDIFGAIGTSKNTLVKNTAGTYYEFNFEGGAKITSYVYKGYQVANSVPNAWFGGLDAYDEETQTWIRLSTTSGVSQSETLENNKFYKKYRISLAGSETSRYANMGVNTVQMSGVFRTLQESNETDYEVVEDVGTYNLVKKVEQQYQKYEYVNWVQPVLASDVNEDIALSDSKNSKVAYYLFDNNTSTLWSPHTSAGGFSNKDYWIQMELKEGLNITNIALTNRNTNDGSKQGITSGNIKVSTNGQDWETVKTWTNSNTNLGATWNIPVSYVGYYKYIRIGFTSATTTVSGNWIAVTDIKITATQEKFVDKYIYVDTYYGII
jgi:hypothetical protein